jgi:hypothetical protein
MPDGLRTIIYPVKDLAKAKAFYGALLGAAAWRIRRRGTERQSLRIVAAHGINPAGRASCHPEQSRRVRRKKFRR